MQMQDENFNNQVQQEDEAQYDQDYSYEPRRKRSVSPARLIIFALVLAVTALSLVSKYTKWNILRLEKNGYAGSENYQAVFLTNGQVYFGKIAKESSKLLYLTEIYYLQVVPPPGLQTSQEGATSASGNQQQPQVTLIKLGNELHGPVDEMRIERGQILFIENLKKDGRVVQAIEEYKKQQGIK